MKYLKIIFLGFFVLLGLLSILYLFYSKLDISSSLKKCQNVPIFSYGGDVVGCRDYKDRNSMPQETQDWCKERFRIYAGQKYENMKCKLKGMSSYPNEQGIGCTENCDFFCCE